MNMIHVKVEPGESEWLRNIWMFGSADEVGGDVEAPTGHYYRVDHSVVVTDSQGFHTTYEFATNESASAWVAQLDSEYNDWCDHQI